MNGRTTIIWLAALLLFPVCSWAEDPAYSRIVQPFFKQHCIQCHGPTKEKGGLRIDTLTPDLDDLQSLDHFQSIVDELTSQSMPPEEETQPSARAVTEIIGILTAQIAAGKEHHRSNGGKPVRRLSRTEYVNTVADLLGVQIEPETLPADGGIGVFDTDASLLYLTDLHFETYLDAARDVVRRFIASRDEPPGPRKIPVPMSSLIKNGTYTFNVTEIPPAGFQAVRLTWWQRHPNPEHELYVGKGVETYEITGTPDAPQHLNLKFFRPTFRTWNYLKNLSNVPPVTVPPPDVPRTMKEIKAQQRLQVTTDNLLEIQDLVSIRPVILGGIENFQVISEQPYFFFEPFRNRDSLRDSDAKLMLQRFAALISRGQGVDENLVANLNDVFLQGRQQGESFWEAIVEPMAVLMCSLEFLYHVETVDRESGSKPISGVELANRLSYVLWRSAPDGELLKLARSGELLDSKIWRSQVERLMADQKFDRFLHDFTDQWLELERQDMIAVDHRLYPSFNDTVRDSLKEETVQYFSHMVRQNLPLSRLIDSDFRMLNNATARHYGVSGIRGDAFRLVRLGPDDKDRGGILTQAGILMQTGTGERSSIVERGAFVARKILGDEPPPPPPNVEALPREGDDLLRLTAAELVQQHANSPQCASCHQKIDPLGMGLEGFDAVGLQRTREKRLNPNFLTASRKQKRRNKALKPFITVPLETRGTLADGQAYQGIDGLKEALLAKPNRLSDSFVEALLSFSNGRSAGVADAATVNEVTAWGAKNNYPTASIIKAVLYRAAFPSKGTP